MDTPSPPFPVTDGAAPLPQHPVSGGASSCRRAALLLATTLLTTLVAGFLLHLTFLVGAGNQELRLPDPFQDPWALLHGLPFSLALLAILLAHEMGHYLACRFYRIDCTLPYVIPAPPFLNPFGTFGAVIRIRSPFRSRQEIFDVGLAGPLTGFLVILPVLALGVSLSTSFHFPEGAGFWIQYGEPLLFKMAVWGFFDGDPAAINLHPIGWAAWFGLFATSLNLLPFGQLDGGHIVYALLGSRFHNRVSLAVLAGLVGLGLFSLRTPAYLVFATILVFLGPRHPPPAAQEAPDRRRWWIGLLGLVVFVLSFIPVPVTVGQ